MFERIEVRIIKGRQLIPFATAKVLQEHEDRLNALEGKNSSGDASSDSDDSEDNSSDSGEHQQNVRDVKFTVTMDGNPVSGATVTMESVSGTTGSAGGCTLKNIPDGIHRVDIGGGDVTYYPQSQSIQVSADKTNFTIVLKHDYDVEINFNPDIPDNYKVGLTPQTLLDDNEIVEDNLSNGNVTFWGLLEDTYTLKVYDNTNVIYTDTIIIDADHTTFEININ